MTNETRKEIAEKRAKIRAEKRKDRREARLAVKAFVGDFTLMGKIVRLADDGEDVNELFEEWLNK